MRILYVVRQLMMDLMENVKIHNCDDDCQINAFYVIIFRSAWGHLRYASQSLKRSALQNVNMTRRYLYIFFLNFGNIHSGTVIY